MRFNPTPTQLVLLVILFAAPMMAYAFAPGVVGTITSMVSVLIGFLSPSPLKPELPAAPVLSIVKEDEKGGAA